jgi:hypothetical protein
VKWIGLLPFSKIQVGTAAAIANTSSPTATRTARLERPNIGASTE